MNNIPRMLEVFATREEWLAARGVGGSDVAAIKGRGAFGRGPWDVWIRFQPGVLQDDGGDTQSKQDGRRAEGLILEDFARQNPSMQVEPHEHALFRHHEFEWATCSPDGLVFDPERGAGLIEAKTSSQPDEWKDGVPPYYLDQIFWSLEVSGLPYCYVLAWVVRPFGMPEFRTYVVEADPTRQRKLLLDVALWHYEHIVEGKEPPLDTSKAARRFHDRRAPGKHGEIREATDREAELVAEIEVGRQMEREGEARRKAAEAELSALMDASTYGVKLPGSKCLRIVIQGREKIDWALVRAKAPEAFGGRGSPSTKFQIYPNKTQEKP